MVSVIKSMNRNTFLKEKKDMRKFSLDLYIMCITYDVKTLTDL